jgi:two-component system alkaline phosphatase synthesis response regulator PhoP
MDNGKTILIVEDESALAEVISDSLKEEGYNVSMASNGEEGLAVALEKHPDLILLDVLMPKKDGITMLYDLRKAQVAPISAVLFLTNLNDLGKIADAIKEGAEGYVIKAEASLEEIVKKVNDFFAKRDLQKPGA